jgi:hypothetical protein
MIKKIIKKFLSKDEQKPVLSEGMLVRFPNLSWQEFEALKKLAALVLERSGGEVFHGPLTGLKVPPDSYLASKPMYIVGCYEQETHEAIYDFISNPPDQFIDIGSAYGYYTTGIALQTKKTKIIGFEADKNLWIDAFKLSEFNKVSSRIDQKGFCRVEDLKAVLGSNDALVCDCEGGEVELLNPQIIPNLLKTRILCETHDFMSPGSMATLIDRFYLTHDIQILHEAARNPMQFRVLDGLTDVEKFLAVRETRYTGGHLTPGRYLYMKPRLAK